MCVQAAFHAGDKIPLETKAGPLGVSGFIHCTLWDGLKQHQNSHVFSFERRSHFHTPHFFILFSFSAPPPFFNRCVCLSLFFSIIPHQLPQLSFLLALHLLPQPFLVYFTSFFPAPSPFFHSLRRSHSLIWDMLDLVSLKATLLTPCLPLLRTARAILNSFTIHQALSIGMLLNGQLFTPYWLFMLILYLAFHLLDLLPFSVSRSASFLFLRCLKYLIYTYWVSLVMWRNANAS